MSDSGPGELLFAFVRYWSRRSTGGDGSIAEQGRLVLVTQAVATLIDRAVPATVNAIAREIGIDQSGASRLIANAVGAGCLTTVTAESDGRRRAIAITSAGRALLRQAHAWQEQKFDELTAGWSHRRREEFRTAMVDLIAASAAADG